MDEPIKCRGCGKPMPTDPYSNDGYRKGEGDKVTEWICSECRNKGVGWE